jgi:hypothetical protein
MTWEVTNLFVSTHTVVKFRTPVPPTETLGDDKARGHPAFEALQLPSEHHTKVGE